MVVPSSFLSGLMNRSPALSVQKLAGGPFSLLPVVERSAADVGTTVVSLERGLPVLVACEDSLTVLVRCEDGLSVLVHCEDGLSVLVACDGCLSVEGTGNGSAIRISFSDSSPGLTLPDPIVVPWARKTSRPALSSGKLLRWHCPLKSSWSTVQNASPPRPFSTAYLACRIN